MIPNKYFVLGILAYSITFAIWLKRIERMLDGASLQEHYDKVFDSAIQDYLNGSKGAGRQDRDE